jgi:hypothetical protein
LVVIIPNLAFFVAFFTLLAHPCISSNAFFWILGKSLSVVVSPSICSCIFGNFKPFSVVCNFLFHPYILKVHFASKAQGILLAARMIEMICALFEFEFQLCDFDRLLDAEFGQ